MDTEIGVVSHIRTWYVSIKISYTGSPWSTWHTGIQPHLAKRTGSDVQTRSHRNSYLKVEILVLQIRNLFKLL